MEIHTCETCHYKSKLLFGMIYHVRRHRSNPQGELFSCEKPPELYSCPHCDFESDLSIVLKEHAIGLHKNEETEEVEDYNFSTFDCESCKFQTFSVLVMLKHVTDGCAETTKPVRKPVRKRFKCDQCPYLTSRKADISIHKIHKHTSPEDIKWLECDKCKLKYKTPGSLRKHMKKVHGNMWFQCSLCPYRTKDKSYLRGHVYRKHSDPSEIKWFECYKCSLKSKSKSNLKKHIWQVHSDNEEKYKFPCGQCSYVAKRKDNLNTHIIRKHTDAEDIKWVECDRCNEKFKSADLLRYHVKKVHGNKWHQCVQCPYKTLNKFHLGSHTYVKHSDPSEIKWFACEQCRYKCKCKRSLKRHVDRRHLGH